MINAELLSLFIHHHSCLDHQNQQDDFHYMFLSLFLKIHFGTVKINIILMFKCDITDERII